jgi:AraC family transcriptional activator of pobA
MLATIPNYELYGELLAGRYTDPVHHESIRERSSRHDWTIRLHRHRGLAQIFLFRSPGVHVRLGDIEHTSTQPMILVVPPGVPHGFRFAEDVMGDVLSLRIEALDTALAALIARLGAAGQVLLRSEAMHFDAVAAVIGQLDTVYHSVGADRSDLLAAITQLVLCYLAADLRRTRAPASVAAPMQMTPHERQAERFCQRVETHFDKAWSVADYARDLGLSAPHLTRICRRILGAPPNELVRQRRLLEARRLLEYTRLPIAEVAHRSGFRDAAYFSRSFKAMQGMPPQQFRAKTDR